MEDICAGIGEFLVTPLLMGPVCLRSQGRFEEPVHRCKLIRITKCPIIRHVARLASWGVWGLQCLGADIFRVLLYCYSLLAMSTVSVTEYTNIAVIK